MVMPSGNLLASDFSHADSPRLGRIHFFWPLADPPLRVPDGWTCRRNLTADGTILQSSTVEHDLTAVQDTHFIAQAMYLRQPAGSPVTLERTVEAISRVLPNYVESVGGDTVTVPDWATFGRDEVPDDAGAHGKEAGDPVEEPSVEAWATVVHLVAAVPESGATDVPVGASP